MQHYSFTVWKDPNTGQLAQTYYFDLDEDGNPIKLGDGSFGIVFRVRDQPDSKVKGNFAAKIFYEGEDIWERFHLELTFMDKIREIAINKEVNRSELIDVLEPKGGSPKFQESDAYKGLFSNRFSDLKISPFVIVMERYDGTLKDLLENKSPQTNLTGYEVLRSMPVNDRIKWTLPFVQACINGLRTLYVGDNAHLDLKPANMFYKVEGNEFRVVIGDMGYLNPQNDRTIESKTTHAQDDFRRRPLLGTLHYRSPEQKDNYEICDASVKKIGDHTFELTIQDPKFNDSIIERDDFVYFSKSQEKHPYMIVHIERSGDEKQKQKYTRIVLNDADSEVGIREDDKTQIVIRKRQRLRTDLFAIGAVAYDLLTCGQSPERFYERLRIWDNHNTSIEEIMSSYGRVASFNSSEPQAQHIFESLNFGTKYAHDKIVRFILGCMLYNSPGSFYDLAYRQLKKEEEMSDTRGKTKREDNDPIYPLTIDEKILCDLRSKFIDEFSDYLRENCRMGNPIVFRERPAGAVNTDENLRLSNILDIIQGSTADHFVERYMLGVHYVQQLLDYVSEIFDLRSPF
ncbi:MAG TPA: hypothetical protein PK971_11240, partial [Saprospiraceae bacterium]|nr:hypothetical protein [Saprospiraceae bacterium]